MAMTREDAATYLGSNMSVLLTEAGLLPQDDQANLQEVINDSLLAMGVSLVSLNDDPLPLLDVQAYGFRKVLRYHTLIVIYNNVLNKVDITIGEPTVKKTRSQLVRQLEVAIENALIDAKPFMLASNKSGWQAPGSLPVGHYRGYW